MRRPRQESLGRWMEILDRRMNWLSGHLAEIEAKRANSPDAERILTNHFTRLYYTLLTCTDKRCDLRCGAVCCYFGKDAPSIQMTPKEAEAIWKHLRESGKPTGGVVRKRRWDKCAELQKYLDEEALVFEEGGVKMLYEMDTTEETLSPRQMANLPYTWYGWLLWIDEKSSPCTLLSKDGRCTLFSCGLRPKLCGEFMCSTATSLHVGKSLGYVTDDMISALDFEGQNALAESIMCAFSDGLEEEEGKLQESFVRLAENYLAGSDVDAHVKAFLAAEEEYLEKRDMLFRRRLNPTFSDYLRLLFS